VWPTDRRRIHNELIGWQISVLGTTYAVIVGFMLYAVWTSFQLAEVNAEAEANSLLSVVRCAQALPVDQRNKIRDLASQYVKIMLNEEWPAMTRLRVSPESRRAITDLWAIVMQTQPQNTLEQVALDQTLSELRAMTEHRRIRQLQVSSDLPGILWAVLIIGAGVTIVSACLFGSSNPRLQYVQVFMLAFLIALSLAAIADINRPFQGSVHVSPAGFVHVREALDALASRQ